MIKHNVMEIVRKLRLYYYENDVTMQQIADRLNVSRPAVAKWIGKNPPSHLNARSIYKINKLLESENENKQVTEI